MSVRDTILAEMRRVAVDQKKTLGPLDDSSPLMTSGLDSLGFAILVARLEEHFGRDPFNTDDDVTLPVTIGDLVHLYERSLA